METLEIFAKSPVSGILSNDGLMCSPEATKAIKEIISVCSSIGVNVTFWNDSKVTFTSIYMHTISVPVKVAKSVGEFKAWTISRANYFYNLDKKRSFNFYNKINS